MIIETKNHPTYPETHWLVIVTTNKGYCFYSVYAGDKPDEMTILQSWKQEKHNWLPYSGV